RDLHFHTQTTVDTLDYSGGGLNAGSKLVIAATGPPRFELQTQVPPELRLPQSFHNPCIVLPGVLALTGPPCPPPSFDYDVSLRARSDSRAEVADAMHALCEAFQHSEAARSFRWIVVVDDSQFLAESLRNFLWVTFTRSDPASDVYGVDSFTQEKHGGSRGPLVIDARIKPHHAPVLEEPPEIARRVDALAAAGGPLQGLY